MVTRLLRTAGPFHKRVARLLSATSFLVVLSVVIPGAGISAQAVPPGVDLEALARSLSPDEIVARLRASGLSRAQVRDRLRRAGYDPSLADRYFDAMESGESLAGVEADGTFLQALRGIGVTLRPDSLDGTGRPGPDIGR